MLSILSFLVANIVIARYLEKRMHVASICHAVVFSILLVYALLLADNEILVNSYKFLLGESTYEVLKELVALQSKGSMLRVCSLAVLEAAMVMIDIVVVGKYVGKVAHRAVGIVKRRLGIKETKIIEDIITEEEIAEEEIIEKRYISFCKFII